MTPTTTATSKRQWPPHSDERRILFIESEALVDDLQFIDADSHVEEGPDVWQFLDKDYANRKPQIVPVAYGPPQQRRD